ncbi:MAG: hypothetical protein KGJ59_10890, partial [Bacteroidota bacterium]|nr:hypothetical protein [Bacteroidota bacterium]
RRVAAVKYYYSIERFVEEFLRQLQGYSPQELQLLEWNNKEWHKMLSRIPLKLTFMKLVLTDRKEESRKMFARTVMQRLKDIEKSQSWLSKQIGLSREGVRQIMMGQWLPQPECIERMEKALNMKIVIQKKTPLRKRYNRTPRKHSTSREGSAPLHTTAAVDSLEGDSYDSRY